MTEAHQVSWALALSVGNALAFAGYLAWRVWERLTGRAVTNVVVERGCITIDGQVRVHRPEPDLEGLS